MRPEDFDFKPNQEAEPARPQSSGNAFFESLGLGGTDFPESSSAPEEPTSTAGPAAELSLESDRTSTSASSGRAEAELITDLTSVLASALASVGEDGFEEDGDAAPQGLFESSVSFLSSLIFHLLLLIFMLFWTLPAPRGTGSGPILSMEFSQPADEDAWEDFLEELGATVEAQESSENDSAETPTETPAETESLLPEEEPVEVETEMEPEAIANAPTENPSDSAEISPDWLSASPVDPTKTGQETPSQTWQPETLQSGGSPNWNQRVAPSRSMPTGGGMGPRTDEAGRGRMLAEAGGNAKSEDAVERGLAWIVRHQQFDPGKKYFGSWNFDLSRSGSPNSGEATSRTAATALALLALLGHGNTREQGEYQKPIQDGIYYLSTQAKSRATQPGYDFRDSPDSRGLYGHVLATLALCEAYAMEEKKDPGLQMLAQGGLQWLLYAQDPQGGGWRYQPHEAGDVSVTTWVVMVLKSAQMAGFEIPSTTIVKLDQFLDAISAEKKAKYRYQPGKVPENSTTAMGLCARVFTGTPRDAGFLKKGTDLIADWGCDETDIYYNYYASLLLRHYGGPKWREWNEEMRDYLILTQERSGREDGSWFFAEPLKTNNQIGGRLYVTTLAVMILEVYYRYLPIYQERSTSGL